MEENTLRTYGESHAVLAHEQFAAKGQPIKRAIAPFTDEEKVLALHYRGFDRQVIVRRLGLSRADVDFICDGMLDNFQQEMLTSSEAIRADQAGVLRRTIERCEILFLRTDDAKYARAIKDLSAQLSKLVGANAPTEHVQKTLSVHVDMNKQQKMLQNPRYAELVAEMERIELENGASPVIEVDDRA